MTLSLVQPSLSSQPTPIRTIGGVTVKLEAFNPGGSHKSRAARHMIRRAVAEHGLVAGDERRILEKTGGNLGVGLAYEARRLGIGVDLVVGLSFSPVKRRLCEIYGARLVGLDRLRAGLSPREVIEELLASEPDRYVFTDQFRNTANLEAHLEETGPEFLHQLDGAGLLDGRRLILVKGAGTGASFTGIARTLKARVPQLECCLVLPQGCDIDTGTFRDHPLEGTAVGVVPPFLDRSLVDRIVTVSDEEAFDGQQRLARDAGFFPGVSSGANYHVAAMLSEQLPDAAIVTMAYDVGDAYLARQVAAAA